MTYSEDEKASQRAAYDEQLRGVKDALAKGEHSYTFPPGVYRSREKIYMEVSLVQLGSPNLHEPYLQAQEQGFWLHRGGARNQEMPQGILVDMPCPAAADMECGKGTLRKPKSA